VHIAYGMRLEFVADRAVVAAQAAQIVTFDDAAKSIDNTHENMR